MREHSTERARDVDTEFAVLKAKYLEMLRSRGKGPFDDEYIDHENEG